MKVTIITDMASWTSDTGYLKELEKRLQIIGIGRMKVKNGLMKFKSIKMKTLLNGKPL